MRSRGDNSNKVGRHQIEMILFYVREIVGNNEKKSSEIKVLIEHFITFLP